MTYTIVGPAEAERRVGFRISRSSRVGKALLGRRTGDKINVETPGGARQVQILKGGVTQPPPAGGKALAEIIAERRRKAEQLRRAGIAPWGWTSSPA